jgi:ribonuclease III
VSNLVAFQKLLDYQFGNLALLELALTHPSLMREETAATPPPPQHNQRLEYLGDAVIQLVLSRELYEKFPSAPEGLLTKARAEMVNRRTLAERGRGLGLGNCLRLSRGEEISGGRQRASTLADTFEAVMGALFLDGGYEPAQVCILRLFREAFGELLAIPNLDNPKGELQELLQAHSAEPPRYMLVTATGPDHDRVFECTVHHAGAELGRGSGKSKKAAESQAAQDALNRLRQAQDS